MDTIEMAPPSSQLLTTVEGELRKMRTELVDPVRYTLDLGGQALCVNDWLGAKIAIEHLAEIRCVYCSRKTNKSFNQGYCYPCFKNLAQCDTCIVKPHTCHYDEGTCREPEWALNHCLQTHVVYLANSTGVKVGITRLNQVPTRWMDQGAIQALAIARVESRLISGLVEVELANFVSDRTQWQRMLKGDVEVLDLEAKREELWPQIEGPLKKLVDHYGEDAIEYIDDGNPIDIHYPVDVYPTKVKALNLDKTPSVQGRLMGIKGQYLILDTGVLNIRKFAGYRVRLSVEHD